LKQALITIVCALNCEAKPWIEFYKLKKAYDRPFDLYINDDTQVQILISGIGALSTAAAIGWLGARAQLQGRSDNMVWLNLGIAGHAALELGTAVRVHAFVGEESLRKHYPPLTAKWSGETAAVLSVNAPTNTYPDDMMVEMEAFAFYKSANLFSSAELVQSVKVISDNEENDVSDLNASKITELMRTQLEQVNQFIVALLSLPLANKPAELILELTQLRATHSQRQQLESLLKKVSVLSLETQLANLNLESKTSIKDVLNELRELIKTSAPSLSSTIEKGRA
jgi:hypothetical protein